MKQIRQSVFETNSSSTHSMTLFKLAEGSEMTPRDIVEETFFDILKGINVVNDNIVYDKLDESRYLDEKNSTLHLCGFTIPDGDESDIVIYLVNSPMAKIQYYFMALRNAYGWQPKKKHICDWLGEYAKDYYKVENIEIKVKAKNWDDDDEAYMYLDTHIEPPLTDEIFENKELFYSYMDEIMKKDNSVVYTDTPYHMWGRTSLEFVVV